MGLYLGNKIITPSIVSQGTTPTGSISITENGTHNVSDYANAIVNVPNTPAVVESLSITPSTSQQTFTPTSGIDGYSPVNVSAVTSSIDSNITAGNIKNGVSILGVTGNYTGTTPTGSISITENGTHNVSDYANAIVNVPAPQTNIIVNTNIDNEIYLQNNSKYLCLNNNLYEYIYSNNLMFPLSVENTFLFDTFISNDAFYINANKLSNNPNSGGNIWCSTAFYDGYDRIVFIDITIEDNNDIGWGHIVLGSDWQWDWDRKIWILPWHESGNFIIPIFLNSNTNCFALTFGNDNSLQGDEIHINRIYEFILPGISTEEGYDISNQ